MASFKYKAVLFDFDGTLVDTWPALADALDKTHQRYVGTATVEIDKLRSSSILRREELLQKLLGRDVVAEEIDYFVTAYQQVMLENIVAYDGVIETIQHLTSESIPWGIVTNKPKRYLELFKQQLPFLEYASCIVCPEDVQRGKPNPEPLMKACNLLKVNSREVIYVGDTIYDMKAASDCPMDFAIALYGYLDKETDISKLNVNYQINDSMLELMLACKC